MTKKILCTMGIILTLSIFIQGQVPRQFSFQGILKDSLGNPVADDVYAIKFRIYDDSTAGNILWETSGFVPVQTSHGLFQHILGSTNPIPDSLSRFPSQWVGITINLQSELRPRTQLVSVPFSLMAQNADTAAISLDKTINAGDLTMGTLDTARFSAYQDLASENKIGPLPDQVAAGNHVHTGMSFPGSMIRYEDTTTIEMSFYSWQGVDTLLKGLTIQPNQTNGFFRCTFVFTLWSNCTANVNMNIGGTTWETDGFVAGDSAKVYCDVTAMKASQNLWYVKYHIYANLPNYRSDIEREGLFSFNYDPSNLLNVLFRLRTPNNSCLYRVTVGNLIVEYDVD
jgi:hypothetical protein